MARIKNRAERQTKGHAYRDARQRLNNYTPPGGDEDETYLRLNAEVERLEQSASWWAKLKG